MVEGASIQPPLWPGVAPEVIAEVLIRLDGGVGLGKGPGHSVDNGDQARCQRDGLRSEGAARALFLPRVSCGRPHGGPSRTEGHESPGMFVSLKKRSGATWP